MPNPIIASHGTSVRKTRIGLGLGMKPELLPCVSVPQAAHLRVKLQTMKPHDAPKPQLRATTELLSGLLALTINLQTLPKPATAPIQGHALSYELGTHGKSSNTCPSKRAVALWQMTRASEEALKLSSSARSDAGKLLPSSQAETARSNSHACASEPLPSTRSNLCNQLAVEDP